MESSLQTNKTCELHVHIGGCTHVQDMIRLGREIYQEVYFKLTYKNEGNAETKIINITK